MTALNKHAELRKELSNPAIGSKDHLRKLALSLLDEVEIATDACNGWQRKYAEADERLRAAESGFAPLTVERLIREKEDLEKRIAEHRKVLNSLAAVARRYLPDYDEHPEIQAADELLESTAGFGVKGE
ncbi:hypothetical protein [Citrobacter portucalensis]|uniref:hypothetical protein n=1 Tax=Citrobacter portucalensis TaxID=1639133 RepID=UPI001F5BA807|nr:hypothetical protein [Citrobacter portucalensis]